jgi:subtilisin family serine protease
MNESINQKNKPSKYGFVYYLIVFSYFLLVVLFWNSFLEKKQLINHEVPVENGIIIPIEQDEISIDSSSNSYIVENKLNIAILNKSKSVESFISSFKTKYANLHAQIIYYDTVIKRIQVEVDADAKSTLKNTLKSTLPEFELLVWDETIFESAKTFSDPASNSEEKSWYLEVIDAHKAWDITTGNKKLILAVIDNGFDVQHEEIKTKIYKPYNVIDRTSNVAPQGAMNHGTHVAATACASTNGKGIVGISPLCKLMPIKVEDQNGMISSTYIVDGILYAIKNGANVINLSLGKMFGNLPLSEEQQQELIRNQGNDEFQFWDELFEYANKKNVTCVIAAGNEANLIGLDPFQRSKSTIKVSAIDENYNRAEFSNFGTFSTISAPGTHIYSAKPNGEYEYLDGTSMASPIVAGAVILMKSLKPTLTNQEIIKLMRRTGKVKSPRIGPVLQLYTLLKTLKTN